MSYLAKAIKSLLPDSEFVFNEEDYSTIQWVVLNDEAPTKKQVDDEIKRIKANEIVELETKTAKRQAIAERLGLTVDELQVLLG